jgi:putative tryptophan/tyrosine transport system substrate-binding protein
MNRRNTLLVLLVSGAAPLVAFAQQPGKVWRIGYLALSSRQNSVDTGRNAALLSGLREQGYVEGKNIALEWRFADDDTRRLAGLAAELVRLKVDVILTIGTVVSRAAQFATATIPIVVGATADPVHDGFAASLARPGGNMTGMSIGTSETVQKCVELLRTMVPKLSRLAVMANPTNAADSPLLLSVQLLMQRLGGMVLPISASSPEDIEVGFATMVRENAGAVFILTDSYLIQQRQLISRLALKYRLPAIGTNIGFPEAGALLSYSADTNDNVRHAAAFVDKIFKGAKPGDLPFELPTRYHLIINRSTANALGLAIPQELLLRADRVIE